MGKRGPQPKKIIDTTWRSNLAYAIGLIATDGCLSSDGLLFDLSSKDREQLLNFSECLGVYFKINNKWNSTGDKCLRIQFKNRIFYDFLLSIGLTPRKSLTIGKLSIPAEYFFDFLRGCFDGDGCFYSYWDPRWRSSFVFYLEFTSASLQHLLWIQEEINKRIFVKGHISGRKKNKFFQLKYAKREALEIIRKMYYDKKVICLSRKRLKIEKAIKINNKQQQIYS